MLLPKLQQLKEEKEKLEHKLSQLQVRRKDVETKQETISKKNLQLEHRQVTFVTSQSFHFYPVALLELLCVLPM